MARCSARARFWWRRSASEKKPLWAPVRSCKGVRTFRPGLWRSVSRPRSYGRGTAAAAPVQRRCMAQLAVLGGNANPALTAGICGVLKITQTKVLVDRFSEGEIRVQIKENIRGRDVFIVQPTCQPVNDNIMELLILIDAARRASADRITAVLPYYGYARQDRKDQPRVQITAKLVANLLTVAGADRVLTMDLHASQLQGFFDIPVDHLYAIDVLSNYFKDKDLCGPQIVVVSPDVGGLKMARAYAKRLHAGLAIVDKRRMSPDKTEVMHILG